MARSALTSNSLSSPRDEYAGYGSAAKIINFFPKSWSIEERISAVVVLGGFISIFFSIWGTWRTVWLNRLMIDAMSANLYLLAGVSGIATLTFGIWMVWRQIGFPLFRWLSAVFGGIGVSIWPVMDYACGRAS